MSSSTPVTRQRTGSLYGAFAFASVILSCYGGFLFDQRYYASEWMVPVVFGLGALYTLVGVLGGSFVDCRGRLARALYFLLQCTVLTGIIWLSPIRGWFGILVLPTVVQAIFDVRARNAALVGLYLFLLTLSVWAVPYGWLGVYEALINYSTAFAFTIVFSIITKRALDAREREEKLRQELEVANQQLREFAAQAGDLATTRERNRLAREIHDGVGHYLTVVKTQLDAATALLPTQPERAREAVVKAAKLTGEALDDVRRSVGALRTDAARPPLAEALRELASHGEPVPAIAIEGAPRALPSAVEHALFRAAQEGLTNIRKHAHATNAMLLLDFRAPRQVRLELSDNGVGLAPASPGAGGFGLVGLRERIELLGGRVECGNRAAGGFALAIEVPA
jgi:signal transduction histidine kinase